MFVFIAFSGIPLLGIGPCGEHWEITPAEAKKLNDAWGKASRHFAPKVSDTVADCVNLAIVAGGIVAPRTVQTIYNRKTAARRSGSPSPAQTPAAQPAANVTTAAGAPHRFEPQTPGQADPLAMLGSSSTAGNA